MREPVGDDLIEEIRSRWLLQYSNSQVSKKDRTLELTHDSLNNQQGNRVLRITQTFNHR